MSGNDHPRHDLDDMLQSPVRLSITAALSRIDKADFRSLRDTIELSDSALSKQLTLLEDAGYVTVAKGRAGRRPRTWVKITPDGAQALGRHLEAMRKIADSTISQPEVEA